MHIMMQPSYATFQLQKKQMNNKIINVSVKRFHTALKGNEDNKCKNDNLSNPKINPYI
jgi:hypothetical protein